LQGKGWNLHKNKVDISDHDKETLAGVISEHLDDLIQQAAASADDVLLKNVNNVLRTVFDQTKTLQRRKAKRNSVQNPGKGTKFPTGRGSPHRRAEVVQPGNTFPIKDLVPRRNSGIQIIREQRGAGPLLDMMGTYVIVVNTDHPSYPEYARLSDNDWGVAAILFMCGHNTIADEREGFIYGKEDHAANAKTFVANVSALLEGYFELLAKKQQANSAGVA
jgi:hypothetical protein